MIDEYNDSAAPERRITLIESHATYLLWIDCSKLTHDTALLCEHLKRNHRVMFSEGAEYGGNGRDFIRINVACPRSTMREGFSRLFAGLCDFSAD